MQKVDQDPFFEGLGYERFEMEYIYGIYVCYRGPDGGFYRIDHFDSSYVIEFAENENEARIGRFEDTDTFPDDLPFEELKKQMNEWFDTYVAND